MVVRKTLAVAVLALVAAACGSRDSRQDSTSVPTSTSVATLGSSTTTEENPPALPGATTASSTTTILDGSSLATSSEEDGAEQIGVVDRVTIVVLDPEDP